MSRNPRAGLLLLTALSVLIAAWGALGWFDLPGRARLGFDTHGDGTINRVIPGSPAELAGLLPGDRIIAYDGVDAQDAATLARLPHKRAGEHSVLSVRRDGSVQEVPVIYRPLPEREVSRNRVEGITGLCFLFFPLLACWRRPGYAGGVLASMGAGLSLAFIPEPHIADYTLRAALLVLTSALVLAGVASVLHFLLIFPNPRTWLDRPLRAGLLYLPAFILWMLIAYRVLFTPASTATLNAMTRLMAVFIVGPYLLGSVYLFLRNFSLTHRAQRKALSLNWMMLGTVLGLVPVVIAQLVSAFSPNAHLPGQDFYFVTMLLIPLSWAWSVSRGAHHNT